MSLSSLPLHLFFLPPQTLLSIVDLTSPAAINPFLHRQSHKPSCHRLFHFALHSFRFDREGPSHAVGGKVGRLVSIRARFVGEDRETVPLGVGLVSRSKMDRVSGMGFGLAVLIFLGFCFILLHWFWWARRGCGCAMIFMGLTVVVVVCWWLNEILFYCSVYIILLC